MDLSIYDNSDFNRGAARWKEALWVLTRCLFFQNPLPWPSEMRVALLRAFNAKIGTGVVIRENVDIASDDWRSRLDWRGRGHPQPGAGDSRIERLPQPARFSLHRQSRFST
ncbi:MAG: hypothetical protein ABJB97_08800 [Acidobacteriota bacterium]